MDAAAFWKFVGKNVGNLPFITLMQLNAFVARHFDETGARSADDILWRRLRLGEIDAARAEMLKPVVTEQLEVLKNQQ